MSLNDNLVNPNNRSLGPKAARRLSNTTKSIPMMDSITPRWLLSFLPWVSTEAGVYRVNKVIDDSNEGMCSDNIGEHCIPQNYMDYNCNPKEYTLNIIQTILKINSQVSDIFNSPINQKQEQMRLTIEKMREKQECELVNNSEFGLLASVDPSMRIPPRKGTPTPDDLDDLLATVWKKPAFFLAHPKAIAAFTRECTCRGVPPVTVNIFGSPFVTWRGVPMVPCDKVKIDSLGNTCILLMRVGEREQGVIGLHQPGVPGECQVPSLSVHFGGIDDMGIMSYIMTLYYGLAVLTNDALGMLENVNIGHYYDYE
ncbi:hypothetical protein DES36_11760 [Alkalibaculum bacchi]|uniref:Type 2A encapsulin shell protein SrpI-like domain-containing protein n=1 Tax=Alkalibaculum bacchi TaxID=645887 RepID=A0A366HZS8_9FIRM|nr:family 2A encapsulin nanocompartment shell protein [Alkalibaculum bacchi]RBP59965.1 hypothetical protein DES36_11760 [Alkalibaculum bacchi]